MSPLVVRVLARLDPRTIALIREAERQRGETITVVSGAEARFAVRTDQSLSD